jgi:predicted phosphate transport protein (TIGR00153 family)
MRFSLIPREKRFFDMFEEVAATIHRAAVKFLDMVTIFDDLEARGRDIKKEEEACDVQVEKIIKALDRSFITPFDREDIHTLATKLDDILDHMEETAHRFEVFRLEKPTAAAVSLARIIMDSTTHLQQAICLCRNLQKSDEIHARLLEITRLENEADMIYREVDAALFANGTTDILGLIKWRELYAWLEETVDACKDVAQVISEIVIKGS